MGRAIVGVEDRIRQPITILRDTVDTRIQDMRIEREEEHRIFRWVLMQKVGWRKRVGQQSDQKTNSLPET